MDYTIAQDIPEIEVGKQYIVSYAVRVEGSHWQQVSKLIVPTEKRITIRPKNDIVFSQGTDKCEITMIQLEKIGGSTHQFNLDYIKLTQDDLPDNLFEI